MDATPNAIGSAVSIGVGASLDFLGDDIARAPAPMSRLNLKSTYRLAEAPVAVIV